MHRIGHGLIGKVAGHKLYNAWQVVQVCVGQQGGPQRGAHQLTHACLILGAQKQGPAWFKEQAVYTAHEVSEHAYIEQFMTHCSAKCCNNVCSAKLLLKGKEMSFSKPD